MVTELPVPPTGKPFAFQLGDQRIDLLLVGDDVLDVGADGEADEAFGELSAMSHSLRMVWVSIWRWVPARTDQTWSPECATWCSTPGRGRSWYFQLPRFFSSVGCMYLSLSGTPHSTALRRA
jgi:hypothetical protein